MRRLKRIISILLISTLLIGCDDFEKKFYRKIDTYQKSAIKNNELIIFNLNEVTDFEWSKMLHVSGNESVPVHNFEIELILGYKTTDLDVYKDRFYFLTPENELIVKEIDYQHSPSYEIEFCKKDTSNKTEYYQWLSADECKFTLIPNTKVVGTGTVFLFPECETKFDKNNFGIFHKVE